jgi:hypothetical protein
LCVFILIFFSGIKVFICKYIERNIRTH